MPHKFSDHHSGHPSGWSRLLEPRRSEALPPELVLDWLDVKSGQTLLDLGAGPGFFALPMAKAIGPSGTLWAADIEEEPLAILRRRAEEAGCANIRTLLSGEHALSLEDASVDAVLVTFVLHEFDDAEASLREIRRVLRPNGRLVLVDWARVESEAGPPLDERIAETDASALLTRAGFSVTPLPAPYPAHYAFRAVSPGAPGRST